MLDAVDGMRLTVSFNRESFRHQQSQCVWLVRLDDGEIASRARLQAQSPPALMTRCTPAAEGCVAGAAPQRMRITRSTSSLRKCLGLDPSINARLLCLFRSQLGDLLVYLLASQPTAEWIRVQVA